jgi:hypothetical protein
VACALKDAGKAGGIRRYGAVYLPPFDGILQQEAVWAINSDLETRCEKPP